MEIQQLEHIATQVRRDIVRMVHAVNSGHPGGSLGCTDLLVALYFDVMRLKRDEEGKAIFDMDATDEDVFFLSNGHISPVFKTVLPLNFKKRVIPGQVTTYRDSSVTVKFVPESLYDTLHLMVSHSGNRLSINQGIIPLKDNIEIDFVPAEPVENTAKTQMYLINGNRRYYVGGFWKDNHFLFRSRQFGTFQLLTDVNPPTVKLLRKDHTALVATVKDDLSGLDTVRALVNGEWILMQYDYKRALVWSDKLDSTKPFEGSVVLEARDRAGNLTTVTAILPPAPRPMAVDSTAVPDNE